VTLRSLARPPFALLLVALAGCGSSSKKSVEPPAQTFHSRPDLRPAPITVTRRAGATAPGYLFLAPKKHVVQMGPLIVDNRGQVVWFHPTKLGVLNFRVQRYRGKPVLTWWQGVSQKGVGRGRYEIYDTSYRRIAEIRAGNGFSGDLHEFLITARGTALIPVYTRVRRDLSALGGARNGTVYDSVVQEVDLRSGTVLFQWRSLDHVGLRASYAKPVPKKATEPYDYFHVNSIEPGPRGTVVVSARNTHAIYDIDERTGKIVWQLGGKHGDFQMGPGTRFGWQHDARLHPDGTLTLFDNEAAPPLAKRSRALVLRLDTKRMAASLVRSYVHPSPLLASSQGDAQILPDGHVVVGWGAQPYLTEFTRTGTVVFDAHFNKGADSYRVFRFPWVGRPTDRPALAVRRDGDELTVYASWNGATEVRRWRVLAGDDGAHLRPAVTVARTGFETAIAVKTKARYVAVQALDEAGRVLGTSEARQP
jgi:Arylsulfotransferase (ASST)